MAMDPKKNPAPGNPDRAKMMRVLIPAGLIALVVILVAVIASISSGSGRKMSDGSDGTADDPDLKEVIAGVKIRDLKEGSGEACPPGSTVKVNYTGWLTDGSEFDSSKKKGPVEFSLNGVIAGWTHGIPGMKVGGIRKLVISADKGYGAQGSPPKIPGGSTLIFEVELVEAKNLSDGVGKPLSDGSDGGTRDPGLKDIGDGLKIRDVKEGSGIPCPQTATVTVHYSGWLVDGTPFDSSAGGEPISFPLSSVVQGWGKGIPGMKPGGIRKLVIPPELGYGARGKGKVPANATMIFEVELIRVN
jgi:peptidylprolyl isomerase